MFKINALKHSISSILRCKAFSVSEASWLLSSSCHPSVFISCSTWGLQAAISCYRQELRFEERKRKRQGAWLLPADVVRSLPYSSSSLCPASLIHEKKRTYSFVWPIYYILGSKQATHDFIFFPFLILGANGSPFLRGYFVGFRFHLKGRLGWLRGQFRWPLFFLVRYICLTNREAFGGFKSL